MRLSSAAWFDHRFPEEEAAAEHTFHLLQWSRQSALLRGVSLQSETRKGSLVYIPANVGGVIELAGTKKQAGIDLLYRRANPIPLRQKIEEVIGVPIQSVVDISLDDAGKIVDLMGAGARSSPTLSTSRRRLIACSFPREASSSTVTRRRTTSLTRIRWSRTRRASGVVSDSSRRS